jgi:dipeptidyl-peptidase 4
MSRSINSILVSFVLLASTLNAQQELKKISLEDIYRRSVFAARGISGLRSMNDGKHYTVSEGGRHIAMHSFKTGERIDTIFSVEYLDVDSPDLLTFSGYEFSANEGRILLTTSREQIYRRSYRASFFIWDRNTKKLEPLSEGGKQQLATFSPDGSKVAFVRENNLFYKDLETKEEVQISFDGKLNEIINGAPDWVYEEEFGFSKAFAWSPDSRKIAFYRFDETLVPLFNMTIYGELYPEWYSYKYPKAGEVNSLVSIHVFDLASKETSMMDVGEETDQYIPRIKWTAEPDKLAIIRLNRLQNHIEVLIANPTTGNSEILYEETNPWYISETSDDFITFLDNKKQFVVMSERDGWMHCYLYDMSGKLINQITQGEWDVSALVGIDQKSGVLYYSSFEVSSLEQHVYRVGLNGRNKRKMTEDQGTNRLVFSADFSYYILTHSSANSPVRISLHDERGRLLRMLEENNRLRTNIKAYGFSRVEFLTVPGADGTPLNAFMVRPKDFDPGKQYPLFMYVYGGPESQTVRDGWMRNLPWLQLLVQHGYVVACVDNRGTNGRGEAFRKSTYMQLGKLETEDQIAAAQWFGSHPWIDAGRIGIYGWSYGGYMSLLCMTRGAHVFKVGIAGAPVTSWRFYDTIYTERFMRTPQENPDGYDDNSPINHVERMQGKLLLIHGTADDNVHFQNSVEMTDKLVQANKYFDMLFYPNRSHGIYGGNYNFHLNKSMTDFIFNHL